jgi:DNA-binding MarR family transcriptional regulator
MSPRAGKDKAIISQLLRASIGLQKALDRCFAHTGLTSQEAAVVVHCAESKDLSAGRLAQVMGRDKGKITRFVDRLEARGFVRRAANPRDHRRLVIRPTVRGQRVVPELKRAFEQIREEILAGVQSEDLIRLGLVLTALHENAGRLYKGKTSSHLQRA